MLREGMAVLGQPVEADGADPRPLTGSGTPMDPHRSGHFGGQCTVTTREVLQSVGYLDTRFIGYGYGHVEWTFRFERYLGESWGSPAGTRPTLQSGLELAPTTSYRSPSDM